MFFSLISIDYADTTGYTNSHINEIEAIKATAYSFYDRGEAIQYNNTALTFLGTGSTARVDRYFNPEQATNDSKEYTVCSSFVYQVFYNTFYKNNNSQVDNYKLNYKEGIFGSLTKMDMNTRSQNFVQISNPNTNFYNDTIALFYIDENTYYNSGYNNTPVERPADLPIGKRLTTTNNLYDSNKASTLRSIILDIMEPGDIITYWSDVSNTGHIILYLGDGIIIESQHSNGTNNSYINGFESATGIYNYEEGIKHPVTYFSDSLEKYNTTYKNYDGRYTEGTIKMYYLSDRNKPSWMSSDGYSVLGSGPKDGNGVSNGYRAFAENVIALSIIRPMYKIENENYIVNPSTEKRMNLKINCRKNSFCK